MLFIETTKGAMINAATIAEIIPVYAKHVRGSRLPPHEIEHYKLYTTDNKEHCVTFSMFPKHLLLSVIVPSQKDQRALLVSVCTEEGERPTEDHIILTRTRVVAWALNGSARSVSADPIFAYDPCDGDVVFVEHGNDTWVSTDGHAESEDDAKQMVLRERQREWDQRNAASSGDAA